MRAICSFLLLAALVVPCPAQDFGWAAKENGIFPIGWTADGVCFAYGTYDFSPMISNQARLSITVQNMKTDKVLWKHSSNWDETNAGDGSGDILPGSAAQAYEWKKGIIDPKLAALKMRTGGPSSLARLPMVDGDSLDVELVVTRSETYNDSFQVRAVSRNLGSKIIYRQALSCTGNEVDVLGYFPNPNGMRIAVLVMERSLSYPFPNYHLVGCNTKSGFVKSQR